MEIKEFDTAGNGQIDGPIDPTLSRPYSFSFIHTQVGFRCLGSKFTAMFSFQQNESKLVIVKQEVGLCQKLSVPRTIPGMGKMILRMKETNNAVSDCDFEKIGPFFSVFYIRAFVFFMERKQLVRRGDVVAAAAAAPLRRHATLPSS